MQAWGSLGFRQISPVLTGLPVLLFMVVTIFDLGVVVSGLEFLAAFAHGVLTTALAVGVLMATALLVVFTSGPLGPLARRALGVVTAANTGMVAGFGIAWFVRAESRIGVSGGVVALEVFALILGAAGIWYGRAAAVGQGQYEAPPRLARLRRVAALPQRLARRLPDGALRRLPETTLRRVREAGQRLLVLSRRD